MTQQDQLAAYWQKIRVAIANVTGTLNDHQQIQEAAAAVEVKLFPRPKAPAGKK